MGVRASVKVIMRHNAGQGHTEGQGHCQSLCQGLCQGQGQLLTQLDLPESPATPVCEREHERERERELEREREP